MNLLSDTYVFYADVYFVQNFIIKVAVIYLALYCNKLRFSLNTVKGLGKIILASFLGTIFEIIGLVVGMPYNLFLLLVHLLEIPGMMLLVVVKERGQFLRVIVTGYFFVIVINGVLEIFWNSFAEYGNYIIWLVTACGCTYVGTRIFQNYSQMRKGIFSVEFKLSGKVIQTYGFYDSGNHLKDPNTGKGVHIVSEKIIQNLLEKGQKEFFIPYQSLGNEQGLIKIYYVEYIRIQKEYETIEQCDVPIGVAQETLFADKKYQMILNEEIA